jgi:hypothetical protein
LKRLIPVLAAAMPVALMPAAALAAPPASFTATGTALIHARGKAPETRTPVKVYYQGGQMRLEMTMPDYGDSVILAQKGKTSLTMMDPQQKLAFTLTPDAMPQEGGSLPLQQIMDLTGWKGLLAKEGKRLGGQEVKAGQTCSLWQTQQGTFTTKIWFADALELPMQIEGVSGGKPQFTFSVQSISTKGKLAPALFKVPADFTQADL